MKVTFKTYEELIEIVDELKTNPEAEIDETYDKFLKEVAGKELSCIDFNPFDGMFKISIPEINVYDKYVSFSFINEDETDFENLELLFCETCGARVKPDSKFWLYPSKTVQEAIDGWDATSKNIGASQDVTPFVDNGKIRCQVCRVLSSFKQVSDYKA